MRKLRLREAKEHPVITWSQRRRGLPPRTGGRQQAALVPTTPGLAFPQLLQALLPPHTQLFSTLDFLQGPAPALGGLPSPRAGPHPQASVSSPVMWRVVLVQLIS